MAVRTLNRGMDYSDINDDMFIYESFNPKKIYKFVDWDYSNVTDPSDDMDMFSNLRVKVIDENGNQVSLSTRNMKIFNDLVEDHRRKYENHLKKMQSFGE
ncbi:hypothetical protein PBI_SCTP2_393 [Salicola phage SCTP-2]|nr:hypothetical protein PBI_SCTP2_393 [Salicola phage SCTP-2]